MSSSAEPAAGDGCENVPPRRSWGNGAMVAVVPTMKPVAPGSRTRKLPAASVPSTFTR
jgi:hypothetical protein